MLEALDFEAVPRHAANGRARWLSLGLGDRDEGRSGCVLGSSISAGRIHHTDFVTQAHRHTSTHKHTQAHTTHRLQMEPPGLGQTSDESRRRLWPGTCILHPCPCLRPLTRFAQICGVRVADAVAFSSPEPSSTEFFLHPSAVAKRRKVPKFRSLFASCVCVASCKQHIGRISMGGTPRFRFYVT